MHKCHCGKEFNTYRQLNGHKSSHTRGETYKNSRKRVKETYCCVVCEKECERSKSKSNKFCSNTCQGVAQFKETIKRFKLGEINDRQTLRKLLTHLVGTCCSVCGINGEYNNLPIVLQVDHIDGNAGNNLPENLRLIRPNCHSQTSTFSGRNKGSGRKARGIKLN